MSKAQCKRLQTQVKKAVLPKYEYNRNTSNAVVYGHADYAGIELRTTSVELGLAQLQYLLLCLRSDGVPHKLAMIALSWAQHLAGTSTSIFIDTMTKLPHLTPMIWIPAIRAFLATVGGTLEMAVDFVPPMQRENDRMIMDEVVIGKFTPTEVKYVNACRLYLGVTFLSDTSNAAGTEIRAEIVQGKRPLFDTFKGLNSYQANPSEKAWSCWRRALRLYTMESTHSFTTNLGRWNITGDATY